MVSPASRPLRRGRVATGVRTMPRCKKEAKHEQKIKSRALLIILRRLYTDARRASGAPGTRDAYTSRRSCGSASVHEELFSNLVH